MSSVSLNIDSNVKITVFDSDKEVKQIIKKHNKATRNLIAGIIKFLAGEFTKSNISSKITEHNESAVVQYIPSFISFGDSGIQQIGKKISDTDYITPDDMEDIVANINDISPNTFAMNNLDHELVGNVGNGESNHPNSGRCPITKISYNLSSSDSITLKLSFLVSKGYYSKNFYLENVENGNQYGNARGNNYPLYLTELGLWANNYSGNDSNDNYSGDLLARVTFTDEDSIIKQTNSDVILVDWKIEITSIDDIFSQNNLTQVIWNNN